MNTETTKLPLWRNCLENMREEGLNYGSTWTKEYFEEALRAKVGDSDFAFAMMALRQELEEQDGLYLKSEENYARFSVVAAPDHETVASKFDSKVRRYAVRSINLRSATLLNPKAELTEEERKKMEQNLERASVRLVLMSRAASVAKIVAEHAPKLLQKNS